MYAWQFTKALYLSQLRGWTRFVSMQNHYNLLYREEEREMIPLCQSEGIDRKVVDSLGRISEQRGVSRAQIALAWLLSKPAITSPIIGATKPLHLSDAAAALSLRLTSEEIASLEEPYRPHPVLGFK